MTPTYLTLDSWADKHLESPPCSATLRAWASSGVIPAIKAGGRWYVRHDAELQPLPDIDMPMASSRVQRMAGGV